MYPSIINSFNRPNPTDRLNSPSHSALHNSVSSALAQIETFVGLEGASSTQGTLLYDVRSPMSNGGGHVQTALKGGTGQTIYTKGDLLVATSASVLSKLAVSSVNGQVLQIDTNQSTGMKWATALNNKVAVKSSFFSYAAGQTSTLQVLFSASVAGSTIGQVGGSAIKFTGVIEKLEVADGSQFRLIAFYGLNSIASLTVNSGPIDGDSLNLSGTVEGGIIGSTFGSQEGYLQFNSSSPGSVWGATVYGNTSINSTGIQPLIIRGQIGGANNVNSIAGRIFIVEKIA